MVERTLTASSSSDYSAIIGVLKANAGRIAEAWAAAASRATFIRGADFSLPEEVRVDRMRAFFDALLERAVNPNSKEAHETLKSAIRAEHVQSLSLSTMVRKQNMLRDIMFRIADRELPEVPKATTKLAIDAIIDRSVEGTVLMLEEFAEMQFALSRWMSAAPEAPHYLDQALSRFCRNAMDYFDTDFAAIFRYNAQTGEVVCQTCSAKGLALAKDSRVKLESFPIASDAIVSKKTQLARPGDKGKKKMLGQIAFTDCICTPLVKEEEAIGLFLLGDTSRHSSFTPDEVSIAEDLGRQVVRVLENAELFQRLSIRSRAQKALIETAAHLQQEIESEEIYRIVASRISELLPSNELAFYVFDWDKRIGNPMYANGPYAAEIMADRDFPVDAGIVGYVARSRKAEIIMDTETDPRGNYIPGTPATHTRMLAVPVLGQKEVLGVIELMRYPPDTFTQEDLEVATLFANHASVALENAKLLKEMHKVRDQIELHMDLLTHDIANYTTPMNAYFDSFKTRTDLDPQTAAVIDKISRQVESILRLVDMVRTIARLREAGPKSFRKSDLKKAILEAVEDISKRTRSKEVHFDLVIPDEPMFVLADDMLRDIFQNLFYSAALSDRSEKTKLIVSSEVRKDRRLEYWWIRVSQPSKSIPDQLKGEVLRMAKTSKSELTGGFGIGLAAARGIVDRYSGNMWVSDIVPGDFSKGCVFNIMLPKAK